MDGAQHKHTHTHPLPSHSLTPFLFHVRPLPCAAANIERDIAPAVQMYRSQVQQSLQQAGLEQQHVRRAVEEMQAKIDAKKEEIAALEQRIQSTMQQCSTEEEVRGSVCMCVRGCVCFACACTCVCVCMHVCVCVV